MIYIKDHKTGYLWDQWEPSGKLLQESWAGFSGDFNVYRITTASSARQGTP